MDPPSDQIQSELENFRKEWRAEVSARVKNPSSSASQPRPSNQTAGPSSSGKPPRRHEPSHKASAPSSRARSQLEDEDDHYAQARSFDEPAPSSGHRLADDGEPSSKGLAAKGKDKEPQSAIDFYEAAVEKETSGKLGDSLQLYRKAFRMDSRVDQIYKNKHFASAWRAKPPPPPSSSSSSSSNQTNSPVAPNFTPAAATAAVTPDGGPTPSLPELIASFAEMTIPGAPPEVEGVPAPPCPIAELPDEILVHILRDVAVADVGDFVRLARVCKRLAYLVATEDQIWRRVCLGSEFGFGGMHYHFQQGVSEDADSRVLQWEPLDAAPGPTTPGAREEPEAALAAQRRRLREAEEKRAATNALLHGAYGASWRAMFRARPRVRFGGCYISTVNYIRAGQASGHQITWNSPVHIVTYYRYLRLFRDGSCASLLTTEEPAHVVHHLTREAVALHRGGAAAHLPSAVVGQALRGRWRLSGALDAVDIDSGDVGGGDVAPAPAPAAAAAAAAAGPATTAEDGGKKGAKKADSVNNLADAEGGLFVETEGVGPKYVYRIDLALGNAGKGGSRNNKLVWKGFWSYNKLTDDWAEFGMKNYRPFFFSRVKSYGLGD